MVKWQQPVPWVPTRPRRRERGLMPSEAPGKGLLWLPGLGTGPVPGLTPIAAAGEGRGLRLGLALAAVAFCCAGTAQSGLLAAASRSFGLARWNLV